MFYKKKKNRHFRLRYGTVTKNNKKSSHPHYVIGETEKDYFSLGLTHEKKKGKKHSNHKLKKNPNPLDNSVSYMRKQIEMTNKSKFSKRKLNNYKISKEDDIYVDSLIDRKNNYLNKKK